MYNFEYVSKEEWLPVRDDLFEIIHKVQHEVSQHFTFQFCLVAGCARNMITRDRESNTGFDFDVNIEINDPERLYSPRKIRNILRAAFDKVTHPDGFQSVWYGFAEDSVRTLTVKVKDRANSNIVHRYDFCIVTTDDKGHQKYIRYNTTHRKYTWEYQTKDNAELPEKIKWIEKQGLWWQVRSRYLYKKNRNKDPNKLSRSIFAETVDEIWEKNT